MLVKYSKELDKALIDQRYQLELRRGKALIKELKRSSRRLSRSSGELFASEKIEVVQEEEQADQSMFQSSYDVSRE